MYRIALEYAGAIVRKFEKFGSYQGDWWAAVTYEQKTGWVHGSYGSCTVCDAFYSEFKCDWHDCVDEEYYSPLYGNAGFRDGCQACQSIKKRLIEFGKGYLEHILSQEEALAKASENIGWDYDAQEMVDFIAKNGQSL